MSDEKVVVPDLVDAGAFCGVTGGVKATRSLPLLWLETTELKLPRLGNWALELRSI